MKGSDRSLVSAIRGPVTLITLGLLFALNNFTSYGFDKTWPVLLIVFGLLSLMRRGMEPEPPRPAPTPNFPPPQYNPYPAPQTSYSQSPYAQPPAKGGFGSSAPAKPEAAPPATPPATPPKGDSV